MAIRYESQYRGNYDNKGDEFWCWFTNGIGIIVSLHFTPSIQKLGILGMFQDILIFLLVKVAARDIY